MAVHFVQKQPSWQEQLATQVLVPMISGAIERQRQRDENRKNNALIAEIMKGISGNQNQSPMPQTMQGGNGWENASHSLGNNPLAQFDAGTTDLMPFSTQPAQATQQRTVTANDFLREMATQLGSKRFGMVDPKVALELATPHLQAMEAQRKEELRKGIADDYINAQDALGRRNALMNGAIQQLVSENLANMGQNQYIADRPQPMMQDMGGNVQGIIYDPTTGTFTNAQVWPKSLTPQQVEDNTYRRDVFDYTKQKDARDFNANRIDADRDYNLKKRPTFVKTERGDDGRIYKIYNDGSQELVTPDAVGFSNVELGRISILENQRKALMEQQTSLMKDLAKAQTDEERTSLTSALTNIGNKIKGIDNEISSMYDKKLLNKREATTILGTGEDIGLNMLGGNGGISSPYNAPRKRKDGTPYNHAGTDYAAKEGTEILLPDVGTTLRVTRVANDATGYGNYVDLKGTLKGHDIELRIAHMKNGSVNVRSGDLLKAGDLIGLVGNTGNSRGKNGGYHMHLEMKIDGKPVDPSKAWGIISSYIPKTSAAQGSPQTEQPNVQPQEQGEQAQPPVAQGDGQLQAQEQQAQPTPQDNAQAAVEQPQDNEQLITQNLMPIPLTDAQNEFPINAAPEIVNQQPTNQASTSQDFADVLREANQGMPQYDLSNAELTASLPDSGVVPRAATRVAPDGGLTQYRAEGDNSPVTWRNTNGRPMRTSDGQLFTQGVYEDWKRKADAGHFKDVGINNAEDLNRWLEKIGMRPDRPSEQRGINNLNGNSRANADLPTEDENITPFNITPSTSPEKFQAPEFTDEINGTTPSATQDLLDGLNGITDSRYRDWTNALRRYYPSVASQNTPSFAPDISQQPVPQAPQQAIPTPQQPAPQQPTAPKPRAGYTNYEQQRSAVDSSAKRYGVDSALIRAIIETESGWRPNARSKVGAMGLMQLMPKTAKWLGVKNAYDPAQNIEGGSKYIAQLIRQFGGDVNKALMAYNCGAGNVKKGRIPAESKRYAQKVMSIYRRLKQ